jgi:hypothetical protein
MSDNIIIQWAALTDLAPVITLLTPNSAYMYLERIPAEWLDEEKRRHGICLEKFDPATPFNDWERGRIFCETFELRWEKQDGIFQVVYLGPATALPDFTQETGLDLSQSQTQSYYLWGNRVPDDKLAMIQEDKQPNNQIFIEFQVPRILRYPVSEQAKRVKLKVCEYIDPASGALVYYRFQGLEEE